MAAFEGMAMANPKDLSSPVPDASEAQSFDQFQAQAAQQAGQAAQSFDQFQAQQGQSGQQGGATTPPVASKAMVDPNSWTGQALDLSARAAPMTGLIGGAIGIGLTGLGAIASAEVGGTLYAAGRAYKNYIEQNVLDKPATPDSPAWDIGKVASDSAKEAGTLLAGEGALKVAGKGVSLIADSPVGQLAKQAVSKPMAMISDTIDSLREGVRAPLTEWIAKNASPVNSDVAGSNIKQMFNDYIGTKYTAFKQAYANLDSVARTVPLTEDTRSAFTDKVRDWAAGLPDTGMYKSIKGYADRLDNATNGDQFYKIIGDIKNDAADLAKNAATYPSELGRNRAAIMQQLHSDSMDFMNDNITKLATRISKGTASMPEMDSFEKMMVNQQNPTVAPDPSNLTKYTKSVANDYLNQRKAVNADYAKFRDMISDVGEQTKVRSNMGPQQFQDMINDVPNEKLVERMFDPKNSEALRTMKKTTPQIYDQVMGSKVRQLTNLATDAQTGFNPAKFHQLVMALPEATGDMVMDAEEKKMAAKVAYDPLEKSINFLKRKAESDTTGWMGAISNIAGPLAKRAITSSAVVKPAALAAGAPLMSAAQNGVAQNQ